MDNEREGEDWGVWQGVARSRVGVVWVTGMGRNDHVSGTRETWDSGRRVSKITDGRGGGRAGGDGRKREQERRSEKEQERGSETQQGGVTASDGTRPRGHRFHTVSCQKKSLIYQFKDLIEGHRGK